MSTGDMAIRDLRPQILGNRFLFFLKIKRPEPAIPFVQCLEELSKKIDLAIRQTQAFLFHFACSERRCFDRTSQTLQISELA